MTTFFLLCIAFGLFLLILEIVLTLMWGWGTPPIYIPDPDIGYLLAPNQRVRRWKNTIATNQYSMRSPPISETRSPSTLRLLLVGDSVANGGWWTTQEQTLSAVLERRLHPWSQGRGYSTIEVLNASAPGWGPRNEAAYVKQFGTFGSQVLILLINTSDLFAPPPSSTKIGRKYQYPDHFPPLAIADVFQKHFRQDWQKDDLITNQDLEADPVGRNLEAIRQIHHCISQAGGTFLLALTPLAREVGAGIPLPLVQQIGEGVEYMDEPVLNACQRLKALVYEEAIDYIDFSDQFKQLVGVEDLYRDHIHLSETGNFMVTQAIATKVVERLSAIQDRPNSEMNHSLLRGSPNHPRPNSINIKKFSPSLAYLL